MKERNLLSIAFFLLGAGVSAALLVFVLGPPSPVAVVAEQTPVPLLSLSPTTPPPPELKTLTGSLSVVTDDVFLAPEVGDGCLLEGGYRDIEPGVQVKDKDGSGNILSIGELELGRWSPSESTCKLAFTVKDIPPSQFYSVEIGSGRRGSLTYSNEELDAKGWTMNIQL